MLFRSTEEPEEPEEPVELQRTLQPSRVVPRDPERQLQDSLTPVTGKFVQLDCTGSQAKVHVLSEGKRVAFLIDNPRSVIIKGTGTATVDFNCGPQKDRPIEIRYLPKEDKQTGTIGLVRWMEFQ